MKQPQQPVRKPQIRLYLDLVLFVLFVLVNTPHTTGIALHEWIGMLLAIPMVVHLVLNWRWIVGVTGRLVTKLPGETRFNYVWNVLLFVLMTLVLLSGIVISESALPSLGIPITVDPFWSSMHHTTANLFILMIGVHLAMHGRWIVRMIRRYVFGQQQQKRQFAQKGNVS